MSAKDIIVGTASKAGFFLKKHSPEILLGVGLVSGVAATGFAIRSTMHIDTVIEQHNAMMHKIEMGRKLVENEPESGIVYTENQEAADRQMVYAKTIVAYGKLYAPTILLSAASLVCLLGAFNIMNRRYAGAVAAFFTGAGWLEQFAITTPMGWYMFIGGALTVLVLSIAVASYNVLRIAGENPVKSLRSE